MIYRIMFLIISVMVLQGCSVLSQEVNLSSGIQYIGENEKIISELENIGINYQSSSEIDTEATDKKLILIEPYHIKDISKEEVEIALEKGFYVFFINLVNDKELQEKYFNQQSYELVKEDKIWTEQIYYSNDGLASLNISTKGNVPDNILTWLITLDQFKKESK